MTAALLLAAALVAAAPTQTNFDIDSAHSAAQFAVRHMMVSSVRGQFSKVTGTATLDEKDAGKSKVAVTIDASTIDTREPKRDTHLRSPDFFDVEKYPTLTFTSTSVEKKGEKFFITGDLTMHGVTKAVTLEAGLTPAVKGLDGKLVRGVHASGKLNRKDFGLNWNKALEAGGVLVGDEVTLDIDAELKEQPKPVN